MENKMAAASSSALPEDVEEAAELYALQLQAYVQQIANVEQEFGDVSDEMSIVLSRLCDLLKRHGKQQKTLALWNRITEIDRAVHAQRKQKIFVSDGLGDDFDDEAEFSSQEDFSTTRSLEQVNSPAVAPKAQALASLDEEDDGMAIVLPPSPDKEGNPNGRNNADIPAASAEDETACQERKREERRAKRLQQLDSQYQRKRKRVLSEIREILQNQNGRTSSSASSQDDIRVRPLSQMLESHVAVLDTVASTTGFVSSLVLSTVSTTARVGLLTAADTGYSVGAVALDLAVPETMPAKYWFGVLGRSLFQVSRSSVDYGLSIGGSLLEKVPVEPVIRSGAKGVAVVGDLFLSRRGGQSNQEGGAAGVEGAPDDDVLQPDYQDIEIVLSTEIKEAQDKSSASESLSKRTKSEGEKNCSPQKVAGTPHRMRNNTSKDDYAAEAADTFSYLKSDVDRNHSPPKASEQTGTSWISSLWGGGSAAPDVELKEIPKLDTATSASGRTDGADTSAGSIAAEQMNTSDRGEQEPDTLSSAGLFSGLLSYVTTGSSGSCATSAEPSPLEGRGEDKIAKEEAASSSCDPAVEAEWQRPVRQSPSRPSSPSSKGSSTSGNKKEQRDKSSPTSGPEIIKKSSKDVAAFSGSLQKEENNAEDCLPPKANSNSASENASAPDGSTPSATEDESTLLDTVLDAPYQLMSTTAEGLYTTGSTVVSATATAAETLTSTTATATTAGLEFAGSATSAGLELAGSGLGLVTTAAGDLVTTVTTSTGEILNTVSSATIGTGTTGSPTGGAGSSPVNKGSSEADLLTLMNANLNEADDFLLSQRESLSLGNARSCNLTAGQLSTTGSGVVPNMNATDLANNKSLTSNDNDNFDDISLSDDEEYKSATE
ncbi:unnamed protein product, partial [Amoebophrya sp. A120]|eukprot:GSA120T00021550001.1